MLYTYEKDRNMYRMVTSSVTQGQKWKILFTNAWNVSNI